MKIAHISDLHFFHFKWALETFLSKSLLGNLNYYINRKKHKVDFDITMLPSFLKDLGVTHLVVSGDFTTTSNSQEYQLAEAYLQEFLKLGFKVLAVPGNHDAYTFKAARKKRFYSYILDDAMLEKKRLSVKEFTKGDVWISLDTCYATPLLSSQGLFSHGLEKRLVEELDKIDPNKRVIILNHFPVLKENRPKRHQMLRREKLYSILKSYPNIKLYLYGHTHKSTINEEGPLMVNSGSLTLTKGGSFHIYDLDKEFISIEKYQYCLDNWRAYYKKTFRI